MEAGVVTEHEWRQVCSQSVVVSSMKEVRYLAMFLLAASWFEDVQPWFGDEKFLGA